MNRLSLRNASRKPQSCLGCIGSLLGLFLLAGIGYLLIIAVFAPWSYYLGGNFHLFPGWQGWGKLHSPSGDFVLYVSMSEPQSSRFGYPYLSGVARLCTPSGDQFKYMHLTVSFSQKNFGLNSDRQPITLHIYNYGLFGSFNADYRPEFSLYGSWHNPNLILEDHGSLGSAFLANGEAYLGPASNQPAAGDNLSITLVPGNYSEFKAACLTAQPTTASSQARSKARG
ncbi:MAG TPA: hypothetical protein VK249_09610 [Anaerolineales bacterium]|nr:hypothetical protein [Anaerolineales bacterium]